ncbi:MAG TPA: hypothetical protein VFS43_40795 [Polyangiaceae bacterium]|nr:hypothetical protein [Polyangiaceae bacterium]
MPKEMPKNEKSNVIPIRPEPEPEPERPSRPWLFGPPPDFDGTLRPLERSVLACVRQGLDPFALEKRSERGIKAALKALESKGLVRQAYVSTRRGPVAKPLAPGKGITLDAISDEYCVPVDTLEAIFQRFAVGQLAVPSWKIFVGPEGISLDSAFVAARIFWSNTAARQMLERGEALLDGKRDIGDRVLVAGERHTLSYRDRSMDIAFVPKEAAKAG